ncbi:hypothetical protein OC835_003954 [Tilletia horrida]|nr:hypothetical protein OC835_003954 [Tilletia horrida]
MFGRGLGAGRLEVDRLCALVVEAAQHPKSAACCDRLNELLAVLEQRRADNLAALGSGLEMVEIERVYAALSWLLRDDGGANLGDPARAALFRCLRLLAEDWYPAWMADAAVSYKRWQTLIGLGVYLLLRGAQKQPAPSDKPAAGSDNKEGKAPAPKPVVLGESSRIAILEFIDAMLYPRTEQRQSSKSSKAAEEEPWEWDGVSELPSLQEALDFFDYDPDRSPKSNADATMLHTIFPTKAHLQWAALSTEVPRVLMQVCVLSLDIASSAEYSELLRATALKAARTTFITWLAEADQDRIRALSVLNSQEGREKAYKKPTLDLAIKAQAVLPGMVSALVKILTGRGTGAAAGDKKQQALPSKAGLAAAALELLKDTTIMGFDDRATAKVRAAHPPRGESVETISTFDELADLASKMSASDSISTTAAQDDPSASTAGEASSKASEPLPPTAKMFLHSAQKIHAAIKQVLSSFQKLQTVHHTTLRAVLDMAGALFLRCGDTLSWAEALSEGQDTVRTSLCSDLIRLILDITSTAQSTSHDLEAKAWDILMAIIAPKSPDRDAKAQQVELDEIGRNALQIIDVISSSALEQLPSFFQSDNEDEIVQLSNRVAVACALFQRITENGSRLTVDSQASLSRPRSSRALSLLALVNGFGSPGSSSWTSNPTFTRWSGALLAGLELSESAEVAEVGASASTIAFKLKKLNQDSQRAVRRALQAISTAVTSSWAAYAPGSSASSKKTASRSSTSQSTEDSFAFVLHFLREGLRLRTTRLTSEAAYARQMCASALFVADELLSSTSTRLLQATPRMTSASALKDRSRATRKLGKIVTQLVKAMLEEDLDEAMDPENVLALVADRQKGTAVAALSSASDAGTTIEFHKGLGPQTSPADLQSAAEASSRLLQPGLVNAVSVQASSSKAALSAVVLQEKAMRQVDIANALLLSMLATAAELLGRDFEPQLIGLIYPLVCASTANSSIVRGAGQMALSRIALACGYASSTDVLRACADWIVSSTSQRIVTDLGSELELVTQAQAAAHTVEDGKKQVVPTTGTLGGCALPLGSAQAAPFVLVEFVRLLGAEALVSVEDAVDEVLDALDRYHGYEDICEGLLGVLRALLSASADSITAREHVVNSTSAASGGDDGTHIKTRNWLPKVDAELEGFERWFKRRREPEQFEFADEDIKVTAQDKAQDKATQSGEDTLNPPPSRSQQIVADILEKSLAFLGHSSAHIRAQVLRLLGYGVSVLAPQGRELELVPVLNRAWPFILARLGSSATTPGPKQQGHNLKDNAGRTRPAMLGKRSEAEPFVWLEAVQLVATLAQHCAEFFGQKIVDDAWPRFRLLLNDVAQLQPLRPAQRIVSGQAISEKSARALPPLFVPDEHSLGSRLLAATLSALTITIRGVSIHLDEAQAWAMATDPVVLGALHGRQCPTVRQAAEGVYAALAVRNRDAVWLLLREFVLRKTRAPSVCHLHASRPELELELARWRHIVQS